VRGTRGLDFGQEKNLARSGLVSRWMRQHHKWQLVELDVGSRFCAGHDKEKKPETKNIEVNQRLPGDSQM
jgi:hypothetical protein